MIKGISDKQMSNQDIDISNNDILLNDDPIRKSVRQQFTTDFHYIMSALGYTVGYGSLWRFPFIMYKNGGGVFLIPYTFFVLVVTIPMYLLETGLGQVYQKTLPIIFERQIHRCYKGFGLWTVFICVIQMGYYNLVLTYSYAYFIYSFQSPLPWSIDDNSQMQSLLNSSQDFFYNRLVRVSTDVNQIGSFNLQLFMIYVLACSLVFLSIFRGPKQSGQVAVFTATIPYVLLMILFLYGLTLDGSMDGINTLFSSDLSRLYSLQIWVDALVQVLFQFSNGTGVYILYGSYRSSHNPLLKSGVIIVIGTYLCGLLGGITIFQYLGHMQHTMGVDINTFRLDGPQLSFIVYPCALTLLPMSNLFSILFFAMFIFLGIDTMMGLYEAVCGYIEDQFHSTQLLPIPYLSIQLSNKLCILLVNILFGLVYSLGCGFHLIAYVDEFNSTIGFICVCLAEIYFFIIRTDKMQEFTLKVLQKTQEEIPMITIWSMKVIIVPFMILLLIIGTVNLIQSSLQLHLLQLVILWLIPIYPLIQTIYIYQQNKYIHQISFNTKLDSDDVSHQNTELVDIKYLKISDDKH